MDPHLDNEYRQQRLANLKELEARGLAPYGQAFERDGRIADVRAAFAEGKTLRAAGRLVAKRDMGKSVFGSIQDASGKFQVYLKKDAMPEAAFDAFRFVDLGDHVGVEGECFTTRTGEPTLKVTSWTLLGKALLVPPEKWHGLTDVELRYRRRYLDLIANPDVCTVFRRRAALVRGIRAFLAARGFEEVETPMMQPVAGGAAARPFETFYNALDCKMFLRIAPELYLKRLMVGGMDKVFELNRNFRNEGLDRSHNPEFTMLEIYEAYGDVRSMKALIQDLIVTVAQEVMGTLKVGTPERPIDLTPPWREATYAELVRETAGADWDTLDVPAARAKATALGLEIDPAWSKLEITHEVYEKLVEKSLRNPTFVLRVPAELIPLAKRCTDDPSCVDVFELVIDGKEVAPAYSELNDPIEQRRRLEHQAAGEAQRIDEDFLEALEYGMPPAGGMGVGIDRLVMILTGQESIRDVVLFPQMKPRD
jgi:lysyl-tRNA synthetase class 2